MPRRILRRHHQHLQRSPSSRTSFSLAMRTLPSSSQSKVLGTVPHPSIQIGCRAFAKLARRGNASWFVSRPTFGIPIRRYGHRSAPLILEEPGEDRPHQAEQASQAILVPTWFAHLSCLLHHATTVFHPSIEGLSGIVAEDDQSGLGVRAGEVRHLDCWANRAAGMHVCGERRDVAPAAVATLSRSVPDAGGSAESDRCAMRFWSDSRR